MTEHFVATTVHGRYIVAPPDLPGPAPLLVGFHGYAEDAETQLERLRAIPGSDRWLKISIQALHVFYRRRMDQVVASWMTRQNRETAIADNTAYVMKCLDEAVTEWQPAPTVVFAGFSQGVAMAFRAAVNAPDRATSVIAVGGDIPPEITAGALTQVSAALIARGTSDEWYSQEQFADDELRLRESSVSVRALQLNAGHEWSRDLIEEAALFLSERSAV